jgi:sulfate transport system substrate-binding protein
MKTKKIIALLSAIVISVVSIGGTLTGCSNSDSSSSAKITFTNVSYDPTRELYATYNEAFGKYWKEKTGQDVEFVQSHGGSGKQALEDDVKAVEDAGLIDSGWIDEFPEDSAPYTSTIVFLVRKGNPKNIQDWDDLIKEDVGVITPNPKTSGGARWNYLAAWAYADQLYNGDETQIKDFMKKLYDNVLVLDSGARGATTSFVENGQGDVLIAWENEAFLSVQDYPDDYEIITPSISILAQPSVAIVDANVDKNGTRELAEEYLNYLYSDEAQRIEADNYYRPSNQEILQEYSDVFDLNINLVTIDDFGGWDEAQETHFADGGIFDQIYEVKD